jgi:hypothetical protein
VSPHADLDTVQLLLQQRANTKVIERDTGNNLYHLAALYCTENAVFNYIVKNVDLDFFARNKAGETLASLIKTADNKERIAVVEEIQALRDKTKLEADKFLEELMSAEIKEAQQKAKKKEKKHKQRIQKAAEKQGLTVEALEQQRTEEEEQRRKEEIRRDIELQEQENQEKLRQ